MADISSVPLQLSASTNSIQPAILWHNRTANLCIAKACSWNPKLPPALTVKMTNFSLFIWNRNKRLNRFYNYEKMLSNPQSGAFNRLRNLNTTNAFDNCMSLFVCRHKSRNICFAESLLAVVPTVNCGWKALLILMLSFEWCMFENYFPNIIQVK